MPATDDIRKEMHEQFWSNLNRVQRKVYVTSSVIQAKSSNRRNNMESSRRKLILHYHLQMMENSIRVCKKMFLNTFDLDEKCVRMWSLKAQSGILYLRLYYSETNTGRDEL